MRQLELDNNLLQGNLPRELARLDNLETFHLQNNNLSGSIPDGIGQNWTSIVSFDLSNNKFTGKIPQSVEQMACSVLSDPKRQCHLESNNFDASCSGNKCAVQVCNACK